MNYGYNYNYGQVATSSLVGAMLVLVIIMSIIGVAALVVLLVSLWKIFVKAGKPGWYAIIPIYNAIVLYDIVGYKWYYIFVVIATYIPYVGWIVSLLWGLTLAFKLTRSFGKSDPMPFALGVAFLPFIFWPIIAFSKKINYSGPAAKGDIDFNNLF